MPDTITLLGSLAGLDLQAAVGKPVWVRVHHAPDGKLIGGTEPPGTVLGEPGYAPTGYGSTRSLVTDEQGLFGGVLPWEDGGIYRVDVPGDVTRYLMMGTGAGEHPAGSTVNVRTLPGPDGVATPTLVALDTLIDGAVEDYLTEHPPTGVTDHGELTGLDQDDHPQYLTTARGDARYVQPSALAPVATAGTYDSLIGTVPTSALPPLAINTVTVVATQSAMLALTAERGDMAIRTDTGRTYVLASDSPATLGDWKEVAAAGQVVSVAGQTGAVTLAKADVGLSNVDNTSDAAKPISIATATAIAELAPKVNPALTATTPAPVLTAVTTPALSEWTLTGAATYSGGAVTVGPAAGSLSTTIPVTNDTVYQVDLTTSASGAGDVTITLGAASATYPAAGITSVTIVSTETGTKTLTISGATWSATITGVTVKALTRLSPAATIGAAEVRAWGTNAAAGASAQRSLTTGTYNTAVGMSAQRSLTTGSNNAAAGTYAQYSLTTGTYNTAAGTYAQYSLTTGSSNTAVGMYAQYSPAGVTANATTTGNRQTSIGTEAGQSVSTQLSDITTVGYRATAGADYGTAIGSGANAAHLRSVALGSTTATTASDQVMVGPRDIEISDATRGVILRSPNGTRYRVTVTDAGTLTVSAA